MGSEFIASTVNVKRCIMILLVLISTSMWLSGCGVSDDYVPKEKYDELQQKQEELQSELNQLREQKKAEILRRAQAYDAIIQFLSEQGPVEMKAVHNISPEEIGRGLQANARLWNLIKATEDAGLISTCQPQGEWGQVRCSYSYLKNYAEEKYSELMAEYNSQ
jgi:outer membrane murein-binding lipoprotein Lpp